MGCHDMPSIDWLMTATRFYSVEQTREDRNDYDLNSNYLQKGRVAIASKAQFGIPPHG